MIFVFLFFFIGEFWDVVKVIFFERVVVIFLFILGIVYLFFVKFWFGNMKREELFYLLKRFISVFVILYIILVFFIYFYDINGVVYFIFV